MEKNNKITIISVMLALIILVILGFIIYYKANNKEEKPKEPEIEEKEKIEEKENDPIDETNYEELSKELYEIIGDNPEFRYEEKVTYDTLSESVRDSITLSTLVRDCSETSIIGKTRFLEKYKEIFNHEKESDDGLCKVNADNYECSRFCNEYSLKIYKVFQKYEKTTDSIILYENVGHLDYFDDGKVYLQASASDSEAIASFDSLDDLLNTTVTYKLPTYKHVFKKINDKYYWESSEVINED